MEDPITLVEKAMDREWRRLLLELEAWNDQMAEIILNAPLQVLKGGGNYSLIKALSDQMDELTAILSDFAPLVIVGALADVEDDVLFPDVPKDGVLTRRQACGEAVRLLARAGARLFRSDPVPGTVMSLYAWTKTPPIWKFIKGGLSGVFSGFRANLVVNVTIRLVTALWKLAIGVGVAYLGLTMIAQIKTTNGATVKTLPQDSPRESGFRHDRWRVGR